MRRHVREHYVQYWAATLRQALPKPLGAVIPYSSATGPSRIVLRARPSLAGDSVRAAAARPAAQLQERSGQRHRRVDIEQAEDKLAERLGLELSVATLSIVVADSEPATSGDPGSIDGDDRVEEPGMADSGPGSPSLVSEAFTVPESVTDSHPARDTARAKAPWNEIQAMFVDDPHGSIEWAAALVDDRVEELIQSLRARQHSMQSACQADDAGTEELRVALLNYVG
jgi:hypothetical protein